MFPPPLDTAALFFFFLPLNNSFSVNNFLIARRSIFYKLAHNTCELSGVSSFDSTAGCEVPRVARFNQISSSLFGARKQNLPR